MSTPAKACPQRTCVALRQVLPPAELLRCVVQVGSDGARTIVPDPQRKLPGRGAWLTPTMEAYALAEKRRALPRALRVPVGTSTDAVGQYIAALQRPGESPPS
ncbi:YlxR family protein [Corynebacterium heidelbergense]|uniref:DUF448 domain-containing protein n=1 Tax=Corynebacterium heidelbergense TaxID=2055947 RepID=A0A364V9T0_9CORY|nr:YlxR family protein [Corynebacterium heidelbergense]RAV33395.1 DUF448 domain-containing protein [Corynebacterium heidelbergense]